MVTHAGRSPRPALTKDAVLEHLATHPGDTKRDIARALKVKGPDRQILKHILVELADEAGCCLICTTGGTGPARRDVTPEATEAVCAKMMPGFGELMRQESLKYVPTAILSRQTAGIRGQSLIVNLPGKPASIEQCLMAVFPAIPYCIDLIEGPRLETDPAVCKAFRPGG